MQCGIDFAGYENGAKYECAAGKFGVVSAIVANLCDIVKCLLSYLAEIFTFVTYVFTLCNALDYTAFTVQVFG